MSWNRWRITSVRTMSEDGVRIGLVVTAAQEDGSGGSLYVAH